METYGSDKPDTSRYEMKLVDLKSYTDRTCQISMHLTLLNLYMVL